MKICVAAAIALSLVSVPAYGQEVWIGGPPQMAKAPTFASEKEKQEAIAFWKELSEKNLASLSPDEKVNVCLMAPFPGNPTVNFVNVRVIAKTDQTLWLYPVNLDIRVALEPAFDAVHSRERRDEAKKKLFPKISLSRVVGV